MLCLSLHWTDYDIWSAWGNHDHWFGILNHLKIGLLWLFSTSFHAWCPYVRWHGKRRISWWIACGAPIHQEWLFGTSYTILLYVIAREDHLSNGGCLWTTLQQPKRLLEKQVQAMLVFYESKRMCRATPRPQALSNSTSSTLWPSLHKENFLIL